MILVSKLCDSNNRIHNNCLVIHQGHNGTYLCGIAGKIVGHNVTYVMAFYIIDIAMVSTDLALTFRNRALDRAAER